MRVVFCPYQDIGLLSPGGIIPHEILHYQFVLNRLLLSSFNSSMPRKPLKWSILMAAWIHALGTILSIVTSKNVIVDKTHYILCDSVTVPCCDIAGIGQAWVEVTQYPVETHFMPHVLLCKIITFVECNGTAAARLLLWATQLLFA